MSHCGPTSIAGVRLSGCLFQTVAHEFSIGGATLHAGLGLLVLPSAGAILHFVLLRRERLGRIGPNHDKLFADVAIRSDGSPIYCASLGCGWRTPVAEGACPWPVAPRSRAKTKPGRARRGAGQNRSNR